jgi:hypothetical protein
MRNTRPIVIDPKFSRWICKPIGRSVIPLLQNDPNCEDQNRDDADEHSPVAGPFHFFAFSSSSTRRRMGVGANSAEPGSREYSISGWSFSCIAKPSKGQPSAATRREKAPKGMDF